jgi:hypothetical protein
MPRVAPAITLSPVSHDTLQHLVRSPSAPPALALRCLIVLAAAAGQSNQAIAADLYNKTSAPLTWTKRPEKLQRIIEATRAYQEGHPAKLRGRPGRRKADSTQH